LVRGLLPTPDVLISSFRTWDEVGRWYQSLQQEKITLSPEIKAKAEELTKGLADSDAKLRAIYNYVSLRYRYVGIAFGLGRYQPHSAAEILSNQFGDCKDKHTLLAALLSAVGIQAYAALINSRMAVDADVPSPGQFDHVVSVIAIGNTLFWMDTTSEVAPLGYLLVQLRGKPALVITPEKVAFQITPSNPPFLSKEEFRISGKLSSDGTLQAHAQSIMRSDGEYAVRLAFRRVPQAQWKDLVQQISYGGGFAGTVSDIEASSPENTRQPFQWAYNYNRKDYGDWENHRILAALPPFGLAPLRDEEISRKTPLWLGGPGEWEYESRIELPKEFQTELPTPLSLKESFAEFQGGSEVNNGVLVTKRHLVLKVREISPDQLKDYKAFQKAIWDDQFAYIPLKTAADLASSAPPKASGVRGLPPQAVNELPSSTNSEAVQAESEARTAMQKMDTPSAIAALMHAIVLDPKFCRAWLELGAVYAGTGEHSSALNAFQQAVEADPKQVVPYKILAFAYAADGRRGEAISTWRKLQGVAPDDRDIAPNLGSLLMGEKRYKEAAALFESAAKAAPDNANLQSGLGIARIRGGDAESGMTSLHRAIELDASANMLNNVAYEMAEADTNLPEALSYSQRSVKEVEERSQKIDLENVHKDDLLLPLTIGAYWDTLGWIYYKMGNLALAESYLNSAWQVRQDGVVGDHLGQVYEKQQKLAAALQMYSLALEANPRLTETQERMRKLAKVPLPAHRVSPGEELSRMRTIKLPRVIKDTANADFNVLVAPSGKVEKAAFFRGSELLRNAGESLTKATFKETFPPDSTAHLLRRGVFSCSSDSGCSFVFYPPQVTMAAN
jgi:tetratricopeptide (TPR) repeat protein